MEGLEALWPEPRSARYGASMGIIVDWNGNDIPRELTELPAGRYVVESVDDVPELTEEEQEGLHQALRSLAAGKGVPADVAQQLLEARARR